MENGEKWKDVPDYIGYYQASDLGRVRSLDRVIQHKSQGDVFCKGKILKGKIIKAGGYVVVCLSKNNLHNHIKVHQLVAKLFIPNPLNKKEIDHINTNPTDNRVVNLRWVTRTENANNPITRLRNSISSKNKKNNTKLTKDEIIQIKQELIENNYLGIQNELSVKFNISKSQISRIKHNKVWSNI